ncbi:uncharacterized protein [Apostichopus japonicus]|uniref:uncharacterized protein n=1 Tax=Stichopus japonicus TaxID=307972 RepID=UPI003AB6D167
MKYENYLFCVLCLLVVTHYSGALIEEDVSRLYWDGVAFYIPVSRDVIQKRLDDWYESNSDVCQGPRLFLPNFRVFPELMNETQHPIYIDFGYMTFSDFEDGSDPHNPLFYGIEVAVTIPLLTDQPDGPPKYSLALAKFYDRSRVDFPKPNILYPYIPADELTLDDEGASILIGEERMSVTFQRQNHPCIPPADVIRHEFDAFVNEDFHLGIPEPHFEYSKCDPCKNKFCAAEEKLQCAVSRYAPNLCQVWVPIDVFPCATSVQVGTVTDYFRDFMLFGDNTINVIASETFFGNFTIGLKYPCIE